MWRMNIKIHPDSIGGAYGLRVPGDYDSDQLSLLTGVECNEEEDKAQQQFADAADINTLVRRFGVTGEMPQARELAEYGDFSGVTDFQTAMQQLKQAQESFDSLPVKIRARFENDPAALYEYLQNSDNLAEAVELGILERRALPVEPDPVPPPPPSTPQE